jgi:hypothetical protein
MTLIFKFYRKVENKSVRFTLPAPEMNVIRSGCSWNRNVIRCSNSYGDLLSAERTRIFITASPSTCGAQWEDFAFEAHVGEQDIHSSEGKDSRKRIYRISNEIRKRK